jgi:hypothetical protein
MFVYILKLSMNKWYVGITNDVQKRYNEHLFDNKCFWTSLYRPIKIQEVIQTDTNFDEDKYTKIYMNRYGIDNVRGASYVQRDLSEEQRILLQQELRSVQQQCFQCGNFGHFVSQCTASVKRKSPPRFTENNKKRRICCARCGRNSHDTTECYATFDVDGDLIDSDESEYGSDDSG